MVPLAVGLASATRVGNLIGEKNYRQAKIASSSTIYLCILTALMNVVLILTFRELIVSIYTTDEIIFSLAVYLLIFAAIFQLPDGIQMGALGSLRGFKDTFVPMILLFISYWIFAMPIGYYLTMTGFSVPLGAAGMWYGMIIGLSIFAIMAVLRLRWIIKKSIERVETIY
jgi:MATE family multidrug resistance protein